MHLAATHSQISLDNDRDGPQQEDKAHDWAILARDADGGQSGLLNRHRKDEYTI